MDVLGNTSRSFLIGWQPDDQTNSGQLYMLKCASYQWLKPYVSSRMSHYVWIRGCTGSLPRSFNQRFLKRILNDFRYCSFSKLHGNRKDRDDSALCEYRVRLRMLFGFILCSADNLKWPLTSQVAFDSQVTLKWPLTFQVLPLDLFT